MKHRKNQHKKGFTLVELLLVVTIIGILAGAVLMNFRGQTDKAKTARAKADIQNFETMLNLYEMDIGDYPTTDEGLNALFEDPGIEGWNGPYARRSAFRDPWGNDYVYQYPGSKGINYDLFSPGKDSQEGTEDDVGNWDEEEY